MKTVTGTSSVIMKKMGQLSWTVMAGQDRYHIKQQKGSQWHLDTVHLVNNATHSNTYMATSGPKIRGLFYFIRAQYHVFMHIQSALHPPATSQYHREPTVSARFVSKSPSVLSTPLALPSIGEHFLVAILILPPKKYLFRYTIYYGHFTSWNITKNARIFVLQGKTKK